MTVAELKAAALELSDEDLQEFLRTVLEELPVIKVNSLVKHLEEVWDVSAAAAPVMVAGAVGGGDGDDGGSAAAEKSEFDVILKDVGGSKLNVIKVVREVTGLGIKEAKALVDEVPKPIKEKVSKSEAEEISKKLTEAGAVAELQ